MLLQHQAAAAAQPSRPTTSTDSQPSEAGQPQASGTGGRLLAKHLNKNSLRMQPQASGQGGGAVKTIFVGEDQQPQLVMMMETSGPAEAASSSTHGGRHSFEFGTLWA